MGAIIDDPLPALEPMPSEPQDIDFNTIIEIAEMNGVSDAMDRLVDQGVSPEQAGRMLESAGFSLSGNAQPEQVGNYPENLPQGSAPVMASSQETRRAEPVNRKSTGSRMDLSFIQRLNDPNLSQEQAAAEYQKLPPALRYVYDRTADFSYNNQGSDTPAQLDPRDAAGWLDEFYQKQNSAEASAKSPQGELAEERKTALKKESRQSAEALRRRASNMIWVLDNLRGGKRGDVKDGSEKWRSRVGSVDGRWPTILSSEETLGWNADFNSLKSMINLNEAQGNKGQGQVSDAERALMAQAASLGLEQLRDEKGFKSAFERMYDLAKETEQAALGRLSGDEQKQNPSQMRSDASFSLGQKLTDKFGRIRVFRGMDQNGQPILDPVQ